MIFSIITDKGLKYIFQVHRSYEFRVIHIYIGIGAASFSQPSTKVKQK